MQYTQEQLAQFQATFALRRRRQLIAIVPTVLFALLLGASDGRHGSHLAGIPQSFALFTALAGVAGIVWFSFRNWRCPSCDRYLGRAINPSFCSRCGIPLR
jgi:hypothetical protein